MPIDNPVQVSGTTRTTVCFSCLDVGFSSGSAGGDLGAVAANDRKPRALCCRIARFKFVMRQELKEYDR